MVRREGLWQTVGRFSFKKNNTGRLLAKYCKSVLRYGNFFHIIMALLLIV